jgi:predicted alpha/beta-fold hydrolase
LRPRTRSIFRRTVREFDDKITAMYCGFRDADDYYSRSSALRVAAEIRVPTVIMTAQDEPFVPYTSFSDPSVTKNAEITVIAPEHGCHCAFVSRYPKVARFWAEACVMEFFASLESRTASFAPSVAASSKPLV